jgi:hypothetical protein
MEPPAAAPQGGGRVLAALLVGQAVVVLGFFVLCIVAAWMRAERGPAASAGAGLPPPAATPRPGAAPSPGAWVGIVVMPRQELKTGALRARPTMEGKPIGWVPVGGEVDVLACDHVEPRWCEVRTREPVPRAGWMHGSILRRK